MAPAAPSTYNNYIDGRWVPSGHDTFENRNPANTDDLIGVFQESGRADVDAALEAATRACETWRLVPAPVRAEMLFKAAQLIVERKETVRARHDPRDGEGAQRDARRRAGGHRHDLLHRR